ncbi:hypothetical protein, partial [Chromobacterium violaceum]
DGNDRLRYSVDPLGQVTERKYDAAGQLVEEKCYDQSVSLSAQPSEVELQAALAPSRSLDLAGSSGTAGVMENGQLKLIGKPEAGGSWAGMSVPGTAAAGSTFQVELTPTQLQDTLHVMVSNTAGKLGRLCVLFKADGQAYAQIANAKDQWREVPLGVYQVGTTYALEFVTNATGGTLYLYAKGSSRAQGYSYAVSGEYEWTQLQLQFATRRGPELTRETMAYVSRALVSGPAAHSTQYVYDAAGRQTYVIDAQGYVTEKRYDAASNVTATVRYGQAVALGGLAQPLQAGDLAVQLKPNGQDQTTHTVYDAAGRLRYTIDPLGQVTERKYDAAGQLVEEKCYDQSVSLSAQPSEVELQAALAPSRSLDLAGSSGTAGVMENGQLKLIGKPEAGGSWAGMSVPGTAAAGSTFQVELTPTQLQDTLHVMVSNTAGKLGRLCVLFKADGQAYAQIANAKDQWREVPLGVYQVGTTYALEFVTNATGGTLYLYAKGSSRAQGYSYAVSGEYEWTQLQLQFATRRGPELTRETTAYVSRALVSGPAAHSTQYAYDAAGRLLSVSQGDGITQAQTVRYELDAYGNRIKEW